MEDITITTYDRELYGELISAKIDGLSVSRRINFIDCAEPEIMAQLNHIQTIVLSFAGGVGVNVFSSWLYDRIKNKPDQEIKMNGIEILGDKNSINIQINNYIQAKENSES